MEIVSLRELVRDPSKVKRMTRAGKSVQITDHGKPLWWIRPAGNDADEAERRRDIDEILEGVLLEKPSKISAGKLLEESRR